MPIRIQRKRMKGWKAPEGAVSVTRPGEFGNPFHIGGWFMKGDGAPGKKIFGGFIFTEALNGYQDSRYTHILTAQQAVDWFRWYVGERPRFQKRIQEALRGKDLMCWCPLYDNMGRPVPCHADVLLKIANAEEPCH